MMIFLVGMPAIALTTAVLSVVLSKILNIRETQDVLFRVIIDLLQCIY